MGGNDPDTRTRAVWRHIQGPLAVLFQPSSCSIFFLPCHCVSSWDTCKRQKDGGYSCRLWGCATSPDSSSSAIGTTWPPPGICHPPLVTPLTSPCDLMWQKWHNIQPWNCLGADYNHDQDFVGVGVWPRCQPLKGLIKGSIFLSCPYKHGEGGTFAIFWHLP